MSKKIATRVKLNRRPFLCFVCIAAMVLGCRIATQSDRPKDHAVIAMESSPTHLDPRYAADANSVRVSRLLFNALLRTDDKGHVQPELAERWESIDDKTHTFYLRRGVTFHDGRPLTSADVKFTYDCVLDPTHRSPRRNALRSLRTVEAIDQHQITFRLFAPHAPLSEMFDLGIVGANPTSHPPCQEDALRGTGPFILHEFLPGDRLVLKANPSYWEGRPSLSGLIVKIIPDAIVRALEFKKGTVDFLQNDIEPDMLPWLQRETDSKISIIEGTTFQYLGMNLEHPILKHVQVRQALAQAIDQKRMVAHLLKNLAVPATGLLSPSHWAYEAGVARWAYDPQNSKKLLDEIGFPDPDGDGPMPRFKLSYKTTSLEFRRRMAEALKEQMSRVGVELEVRTYEWGTFYDDIKKGNFHLYSLSWVGVKDPDIYFDLFHSTSAPPLGNNRGRYRNPRIDMLLQKGRQTLDDRARRRIYSDVQKILAIELPYIPLWWTKNVVVMKPTLGGFSPYPDGDLISFKKVFLNPPPA